MPRPSWPGSGAAERSSSPGLGGDLRSFFREREHDFLWLADMQENARENLYVDRIHYNAKFSGEIAGRILEYMNARSPSTRAKTAFTALARFTTCET